MAKREKKYLLPSEILVRRVVDGDDDYLLADTDPAGFENGDFVGVYELREVKVKRVKHTLETNA
jgi:hypothetical protein